MDRRAGLNENAVMKAILLAGTLVILAGPAAAQTLDVKTGLWETTRNVESRGVPPLEEGRMTPEQKARVEEMIKSREAEGPRTHASKECLTQEELERAPFAGFEGEAQTCVDSVFEHTASHWRGKSVCTLGARKREIEIDVSALSPEHVKGTVRSKLSGGGRVMTSQGTFTGRWLAADCGRRN
jgi:hypothetical protein